jgi:amidophosphoribosyltransferase
MLREAGAAEIHVRISSPPITWPCFYGIDFATRAELIATGLGVDEVRQSIGADSLGYLTKDGMVAATDQPESQLCTACFTGKYPIALPASSRLGKNLLERPEGSASADSVDADAARAQQEVLND